MTKNNAVSMRAWALPVFVAGAVLAATNAMAAPDLNGGTWEAIDPPQTIRTIDGKVPPLLRSAKAVYQKNIRARKRGDLAFDTTEKCISPGLPRVVYMTPFEFVQRPEVTAIIYQWNHLVRMVYMNVPQPKVVGPTYQGQSVGKWDDGSLVVDSVAFNDSTLLDAAGLPHSDALHVTERYTPSNDGQRMKVRFTIDDPKTYASPWQTELELRHNLDGQISEDICVERQKLNWGSLNKDD